MQEINRSCNFNILHVCDYNAPYSDLSPFRDYPGQVVNCNPQLTTGRAVLGGDGRMFKPAVHLGGLDRHGIIAHRERTAGGDGRRPRS